MLAVFDLVTGFGAFFFLLLNPKGFQGLRINRVQAYSHTVPFFQELGKGLSDVAW